MPRASPRVELLWWRGCPSWPEALAELEVSMEELDLDSGAVELREIESDAQAEAERFPGSPTIRVDGEDVQTPPAGEPGGLTCRVYRMRDGRISATPDPVDVKEALRQAIANRNRDAA